MGIKYSDEDFFTLALAYNPKHWVLSENDSGETSLPNGFYASTCQRTKITTIFLSVDGLGYEAKPVIPEESKQIDFSKTFNSKFSPLSKEVTVSRKEIEKLFEDFGFMVGRQQSNLIQKTRDAYYLFSVNTPFMKTTLNERIVVYSINNYPFIFFKKDLTVEFRSFIRNIL